MDPKASKRVDRIIMCISECAVRFDCSECEGGQRVSSGLLRHFGAFFPAGPRMPTDAVRKQTLGCRERLEWD